MSDTPEVIYARGFEEARQRAIKYHRHLAENAEGRARYFLHGPGWRTHLAGAAGAEKAGRDYQKIAQLHHEMAKFFESLQPRSSASDG